MIGNCVPLVETLREGRAVIGEVSLRTKSGQFLSVKLQTVPFRDDHGSVRGAVEVLGQPWWATWIRRVKSHK